MTPERLLADLRDGSACVVRSVDAFLAVLGDHVRIGLETFEEMSGWLWGLSIVFFGVGDLLTTGFATSAGLVEEGSPAVNWVLQTYGTAGLAGVKALSFVVAYTVWRNLGSPQAVTVPLAFAVFGLGLTTWNLFAIGYVLTG